MMFVVSLVIIWLIGVFYTTFRFCDRIKSEDGLEYLLLFLIFFAGCLVIWPWILWNSDIRSTFLGEEKPKG
jgi:hypothetical protein